MITIENVNKVFINENKKIPVLNNISLEIPTGIIYGIIGYSGAGKSTLIRLLNGLETPTSGEIIVNDQIITGMKTKELQEIQKNIGMVFQQFNLLSSKNIIENVALPLKLIGVNKNKRYKKALEMLEIVGLSEKATKYPSQLSGGQKQRVAIARALIRKPQILLCDEATSALDPKSTTSILDLLAKINNQFGITVVMVTHEMEAVRRICQQVAVMENGKIVEQGTVDEVFKAPKSKVAQEIINNTIIENDIDSIETLNEIKEKADEDELIFKLVFDTNQAHNPMISQLSRKFINSEISILGGQLQPTTGGVVGNLIIKIKAEKEVQQQIKEFLNEKSVRVEGL